MHNQCVGLGPREVLPLNGFVIPLFEVPIDNAGLDPLILFFWRPNLRLGAKVLDMSPYSD